MSSNTVVQDRIDADVRDRAAAVPERMGLTVSDAVRILLTRTANEGALPMGLVAEDAEHDAWFREKVLRALRDERPDVSEQDTEARFARRRDRAGQETGGGSP